MGRQGLGRPAKPTTLKMLHGDRKDRINDAEPRPSAGPAVVPEILSAEAKAVWARVAPDLERKGVLTPWDVDELAVFCDAVARWRAAAAVLDEHGLVGENRFGERVLSPWFRAWADAAATLGRFGGRFGLSPADRQTLKVGVDDGQAKDDLLSG